MTNLWKFSRIAGFALALAVAMGSCAGDRSTDPLPEGGGDPPVAPPPAPPPPPPPPAPSGDPGIGFVIWSADGTPRVIPGQPLTRELAVVDINDSGEVAGIIIDLQGRYSEGFVWSESAGFKRLGTLGGFDGGVIVRGINASGIVTGYKYAFTGSGTQSFVASRKTALQVIPFEGFASMGINDGGTVAGSRVDGPITWHPQSGLKSLQGMPAECSVPTDINIKGDVLGWSGNELYGMGCVPQDWIVWRQGAPPATIMSCPTGCRLDLLAFNDEGMAAGLLPDTAVRVSVNSLISATTMEKLPGAGAHDINERGDIAGAMREQNAPPFMFTLPYIWKANGAVVRLELPSGATRGAAVAINNNGVAVGRTW